MKVDVKNYAPVTSEQIKNQSGKETNKKGNILTTEIKAYRDEMLTGLTDEEKEEINKRIKEYIKSHPIKSETDKQELINFTASLLDQYGFKGDCMEQARGMVSDFLDKSKRDAENGNTSTENSLKMKTYQKDIICGELAKLRVFKEV